MRMAGCGPGGATSLSVARTHEAAELDDTVRAMMMNRWQRMTASSSVVLALALVALSGTALGDEPAAAQVERAGGAVVQVAGCGDGNGGLVRQPTSRTGHVGSMRAV